MINLHQTNYEPCPTPSPRGILSYGNGKEEGNPRRNRMEESGLEINRGLVTAAKRGNEGPE